MLEEILQKYFHCRNPFVTRLENDMGNILSGCGQNAYNKLTCLISDLGNIGVLDSDSVISKLDEIVDGGNY